MVRSAWSSPATSLCQFHSGLPMGPSDPLKLAWCAVNRITQSGRVAGVGARISVDDALRAITISAAHSSATRGDLGSIAVGKIANFTVLGANPYEVDPLDLDRVPILGTVFEGRWFPATEQTAAAEHRTPAPFSFRPRPWLWSTHTTLAALRVLVRRRGPRDQRTGTPATTGRLIHRSRTATRPL